jgi:hypothetical protein
LATSYSACSAPPTETCSVFSIVSPTCKASTPPEEEAEIESLKIFDWEELRGYVGLERSAKADVWASGIEALITPRAHVADYLKTYEARKLLKDNVARCRTRIEMLESSGGSQGDFNEACVQLFDAEVTLSMISQAWIMTIEAAVRLASFPLMFPPPRS